MTLQQRAALDFLVFSLNQNMTLPQSVDEINWSELYDFAKKQSIIGIYFYGMQQIPVEHPNKPTDDDVMQWFGAAKKIRTNSELQFQIAVKTVNNLRQEGFRSAILKGQSNAILYPDPYLRQAGDIDAWVDATPRAVVDYTHGYYPCEKACYHHIHLTKLSGIPIELHYRPAFLNNPLHNMRLQLFFRESAEEQFQNMITLPDGYGEIPSPTPAFNRIFQLAHIANHYVHEGIGLRHLCDYYLLLSKYPYKSVEEQQKDTKMIKDFGLTPIATAVSYIMKTVFCLPEALLPMPSNEKKGKRLLEDILEGGNFGHHHHAAPARSALQRNIRRLIRDITHTANYPTETLAEPMFRLYHYFWRQRYNK